MTTYKTSKHHWNYYSTIESDLKNISRYIEFSETNMNTYSIELTRILLAASSEIDVIMKQLCALLAPKAKAKNINDYREIINNKLGDFTNEEIIINRYGISYRPWESWNNNVSPGWWTSHNNVKHHRYEYFNEANLENTIKAVGALLITVIYYYKYAFSQEVGNNVSIKDTTYELVKEISFISMNYEYYFHFIVG